MKTILDFFEPWPSRLSLIIFCGAVAMLGYNWICWSCLTASDWGTWIGAVGTVGALIGTIWLATAAERRRDREERGRALVAATALRIRVSQTANVVQFAIDALRDTAGGNYLALYAQLANALQDVAQWSDGEILPLLILQRGVTANLAGARSSVQHCVTMLRRASATPIHGTQRLPDFEIQMLGYLEATRASLGVVQNECGRFVRTPPHRDYH